MIDISFLRRSLATCLHHRKSLQLSCAYLAVLRLEEIRFEHI
jgi:hypothetical protein